VLSALILTATLAVAPPILVLDGHDYVYPRVSPDGTRLVVARATQRPDGTETTDVLLVDIATGATRELVSRSAAEANETYETFVIGLHWVDDRRVEVSLSDGDVGGADLLVDARTGKILRTEYTGDEDIMEPTGFADVLSGSRFYSRHFSREELAQSLSSSGVRFSEAAILVRRTTREETTTWPLFHIDAARRRIERIGSFPQAHPLRGAVEFGRGVVFLLFGENEASVHSYQRSTAKKLATWSVPTRNQCPRLVALSSRLFVFVRPCERSEPSRASLWEVTQGAAIPRPLVDHVDEFSMSADGSRVVVGVWRDGKRIVQVFDGSVLPPAE
jgi:hypothetical protein